MRLEPGQRIGDRYTLIERIGSGGMADVWSADDSMLGRQVALKFLHERFAQDEQFVERFRREAQAAAGLQHPNVVGVYDRGEHEGRHWIAMEYVQGASLKDLIAAASSVAEAVEIVRQILAGARFAHERGIVHRDLKPHNVLVDADGRARVADFGIARAGASEITQTGSVLGTAQYLSPEQAQGFEVTADVGPLLGRRDPLRGADRAGPVRGRDRGRDRAQAGLRAAAPPARAEPAGLAGARGRGAEGARQGPGRTASRRRTSSCARSTTPRTTRGRRHRRHRGLRGGGRRASLAGRGRQRPDRRCSTTRRTTAGATS